MIKVYDYLRSIVSTLSDTREYQKCDFSILCDKYLLIVDRNTFCGRFLYVSLANNTDSIKLYFENIAELWLYHITITTNLRMKLSMKSQEFFINGNTNSQEHKRNIYYNYSLERTDVPTRNKIT